jgi:hypothetical protein
VHFSFKGFVLGLGMVLCGSLPISAFAQAAQTTPTATPATPASSISAKPTPTPVPEKTPKPDKNVPQVFTADQVAESVILIYGNRNAINQIKRTTFERGKLIVNYPDGSSDNATYEKRIIRGESTEKDKWRLDQKFPSVEYAMVFNAKIFGLLAGNVFSPREEAINSFQAQIWHSFDTLLRYKENGSKIELGEKQKNMGVEYYVLDITDKEDRKTRFFISTKTLRILSMEYEMSGVKYTRKFYDYRIAQGMLVPYRSVLMADDKQIEESTISTVTYGQKVEESYFQES